MRKVTPKQRSDHSVRRGFTIVELLIVIVIIGILATIVIVAYNGIQQRAQNAKTLVAVDAYKTALSLYMVDHGALPDLSAMPSGGFCLGTGYPDVNADGKGDCVVNPDGTTVVMSAISQTQDPLVPYMRTQINLGGPLVRRSFIPPPDDQYFVLSSVRLSPSNSYISTLDGKLILWWIIYIMQGEKCRAPIARASGDTTSSNFFSVSQGAVKTEPWYECYEPFISA